MMFCVMYGESEGEEDKVAANGRFARDRHLY